MNPYHPEHYPRRALVCLLGHTPQILTETLYALARQQQPAWLPTEIHVITTTSGADFVRRDLLADGAGHYHQLLNDFFPSASIEFGDDPRWIHVIARKEAGTEDGACDIEAQGLEDIDDLEDNAAAADTIVKVVARLASDPACAIHASIAGGRKTMGFFLGYAVSLLGRAQDRLSHTLVSKPFENHPEFFYPPRVPRMLRMRDGSEHSTEKARVMLAPIRVVPFAAGLREKLVDQNHGFDDLVQQAESDLVPQHVLLSPASCTVRVGEACVQLEPVLMAWYAYLAQRRRDRLQEPGILEPGMVRIDHKAPERNIGIDHGAMAAIYQRIGIRLESTQIDQDAFRSRVSDINKALRQGFVEIIADRLTIKGPGERRKRDGQYGLSKLDPRLISIG